MSISVFAKPSEYSNLNRDEYIQFITGAAWLETQTEHRQSEPDRKVWKIPVRVWVYEPENSYFRKGVIAKTLQVKYGLEVTENTRNNFERRINLLIADNERGKRIVIELQGKRFVLNKTDPRGHSETIIALPVEEMKTGQSEVSYRALLKPGDEREFRGSSLLIPPEGLSIISDIDDTIKVSEVRDHASLFNRTFFQEFVAVEGMSALYQALAQKKSSVHFVSSSPWQLYSELDNFMTDEDFPPRSIYLKTVRFKDKSFFNLFKSGDKTKPQQIEPLIKRYPKRKFILVGDSGEEDQQVYETLLQAYPEQIIAAFIRELQNDDVNSSAQNMYFFQHADDIKRVLKDLDVL